MDDLRSAAGRPAAPATDAALDADALRPCPFCGASPRLDPDPWLADSFRIACGNAACRVAPRTEYLLAAYAAELGAVWNGAEPDAPDARPRADAWACCGRD